MKALDRLNFYFFDTSALIKRYHKEKGSETVDSILDGKNNVIVISNLTIIETTSAFVRKRNERKISSDELNIVLSKFYADVLEKYIVIDLDNEHFKKSLDFILKDNLRTLDSLQLAVATDLKNLKVAFVCSDTTLCNVAQKFFTVLNPEET